MSLRQRVMDGDTVLGAMVFECFSPGIAQIMRLAGCEYVIYDMEHTGIGYETIKAQVAHCRGLGIVTDGAGAAVGLRVPGARARCRVRGRDDPDGQQLLKKRATSSRRAATRRSGVGVRRSGSRTITTRPARRSTRSRPRMHAISSLRRSRPSTGSTTSRRSPRLTESMCLWVGHFDLTNFLGIPGEFDSKLYKDALKRVVKAGREAMARGSVSWRVIRRGRKRLQGARFQHAGGGDGPRSAAWPGCAESWRASRMMPARRRRPKKVGQRRGDGHVQGREHAGSDDGGRRTLLSGAGIRCPEGEPGDFVGVAARGYSGDHAGTDGRVRRATCEFAAGHGVVCRGRGRALQDHRAQRRRL